MTSLYTCPSKIFPPIGRHPPAPDPVLENFKCERWTSGPEYAVSNEDFADPVAGEGEVVAKVLACGAGLTIQHLRAGRLK